MKRSWKTLKPFASVMLVVTSLLAVAFLKMEVRRLGYSILSLSRLEKSDTDQRRSLSLAVSRLTRPDLIENLAQTRLALARPNKGQIVQVNGEVTIRAQ